VSCAKTDCGGPKSRRFSRKRLPSRASARSPVRQVAGTGPATLKPGPVGAEKGRGSSGGAEGERESDGREGGDDGAPRPNCARHGRRHPAALWTCVARRRTGRGKGASSLASAADSPKDKEVGRWKIGERQPHFFSAVFVGQAGAQPPKESRVSPWRCPPLRPPPERRSGGEPARVRCVLPYSRRGVRDALRLRTYTRAALYARPSPSSPFHPSQQQCTKSALSAGSLMLLLLVGALAATQTTPAPKSTVCAGSLRGLSVGDVGTYSFDLSLDAEQQVRSVCALEPLRAHRARGNAARPRAATRNSRNLPLSPPPSSPLPPLRPSLLAAAPRWGTQ
jgi:hypothetical protein